VERDSDKLDVLYEALRRPSASGAVLAGVGVFVAALLSVNAKGQQADSTFRLPSGKTITMKVEELRGQRSGVIFSDGNRSGKVTVGPIPPSNDDPYPLRVRALSLPSMKTPLILAFSSEAGGSDCSYAVTPIGVEDGPMSRYIPSEEVTFSNEGGLAIWGVGAKTRMVVWNPIWAGHEGHYDAHRYVYYWSSWNESRHKFLYIRSNESSKRLESAEDSLDLTAPSTIEISYRTRAEWFPEAADGC
jgi:hypothetical protein